jgi:hypothetical protein
MYICLYVCIYILQIHVYDITTSCRDLEQLSAGQLNYLAPGATYIYTFIFIHTHIHTHARAHTNIHTFIYICICIYIYVICIYTYTYFYVYAHKHTHTHTYLYTSRWIGQYYVWAANYFTKTRANYWKFFLIFPPDFSFGFRATEGWATAWAAKQFTNRRQLLQISLNLNKLQHHQPQIKKVMNALMPRKRAVSRTKPLTKVKALTKRWCRN